MCEAWPIQALVCGNTGDDRLVIGDLGAPCQLPACVQQKGFPRMHGAVPQHSTIWTSLPIGFGHDNWRHETCIQPNMEHIYVAHGPRIILMQVRACQACFTHMPHHMAWNPHETGWSARLLQHMTVQHTCQVTVEALGDDCSIGQTLVLSPANALGHQQAYV